MSKTILAEVDGFTPIIDELARQYGLTVAAVFGRVWRYCNYYDGVCYASVQTIANDLGLNRRTVIRSIQKLCDDRYLEDQTPDLHNRPHTYADTGKAQITGKFGSMVRQLEEQEPEIGVTNLHTDPPPIPAMTNSHTTVTESHTQVCQNVTPAVTNCHTKKVLKKELKKEIKKSENPPPVGNDPPPKSSGDIWQQTLDSIVQNYGLHSGTGATIFREYLKPTQLVSQDKNCFVVAAQKQDHLPFLVNRYSAIIRRALAGVTGLADVQVEFVYLSTPDPPAPNGHNPEGAP